MESVPDTPERGRARERDETPKGKGKEKAREEPSMDPAANAFVHIGGKAGDETLYGESFDSTAVHVDSD